MTAAELASFRALLQAQCVPPAGPDRGLFARMRARLTVVEGGGAPAPARAVPRHDPPPRLELVAACAPEGPVADPPPSSPPAFGRRDGTPPARPHVAAAPCAEEIGAPPGAVRLRRPELAAEGPSTPDDLDEVRLRAPPACEPSPAPLCGTIAGWSRARPPSAQRRLLGRLEAVLLAERQGLDMRREADAPPR